MNNPHDIAGALYDEVSAQVGNHAHEVLFGLVVERLHPGELVCDLGIGTGLASWLFHRAGLQVWGVDFAGQMLEACRARGFAHALVVHDLRTRPWPLPAGTFHHAVACGVLQFMPDVSGFLDEVARLVRPGGTFSFTTMEGAPDEAGGVELYTHDRVQVEAALAHGGFRTCKDVAFSTPQGPGSERLVHFRAWVALSDGA